MYIEHKLNIYTFITHSLSVIYEIKFEYFFTVLKYFKPSGIIQIFRHTILFDRHGNLCEETIQQQHFVIILHNNVIITKQ